MAKAKEISVTVSKKMSENYNSVGLTASITTAVEDSEDLDMAFAGNWDYVWEQIEKQEEALKEKFGGENVGIPTAQPSALQKPTGGIEDNVTCPIHNVKMNHYSNADGEWWSHKVGNKWCNGRNNLKNKSL